MRADLRPPIHFFHLGLRNHNNLPEGHSDDGGSLNSKFKEFTLRRRIQRSSTLEGEDLQLSLNQEISDEAKNCGMPGKYGFDVEQLEPTLELPSNDSKATTQGFIQRPTAQSKDKMELFPLQYQTIERHTLQTDPYTIQIGIGISMPSCRIQSVCCAVDRFHFRCSSLLKINLWFY